jgi:hypothetical protein
VWFSTGRDLPTDPLRLHEFRTGLYNFRIRESILISLLEFAERFGANPLPLNADLDGVNSLMREGEELYLDWDFDAAIERAAQAADSLKELESEALELKDRALLWIYLLEWFVVAGISMLAGTLLWSIMVRRRLYREVGTTRGVVR